MQSSTTKNSPLCTTTKQAWEPKNGPTQNSVHKLYTHVLYTHVEVVLSQMYNVHNNSLQRKLVLF